MLVIISMEKFSIDFQKKNTLYFLVEMLSPHTAVEKAFPSFKLAMKIFTKVDI